MTGLVKDFNIKLVKLMNIMEKSLYVLQDFMLAKSYKIVLNIMIVVNIIK